MKHIAWLVIPLGPVSQPYATSEEPSDEILKYGSCFPLVAIDEHYESRIAFELKTWADKRARYDREKGTR